MKLESDVLECVVAAVLASSRENTPVAAVRRYRLVLQELRATGGPLIDEAPVLRKPTRVPDES
jgi:hypothetical protein